MVDFCNFEIHKQLFTKKLKYFVNLLMTNVPHHIETSQLICSANQLTGFYVMKTLVVKRLKYAIKYQVSDFLTFL